MLTERPVTTGSGRTSPIGPADLALARYDERGVFVDGRARELELLRTMGARDAALGRLYEGHFNGALIVALYGSAGQRARAAADVRDGALFGVWNTQDDEPVRFAESGGTFLLAGAKTWASGGDSVTRAIVTARGAGDGTLTFNVPLDRIDVEVDRSGWQPLGMQRSNSFRVVFDGVSLSAEDVVGRPGDYERAPHFLGGALRFLAVHSGAIDRLVDETLAFLASRGRASDPYHIARAGEMRVAARTAHHWVDAGRMAWSDYDADPCEATAGLVVDVVDMARVAVERAALDVLERATRSVGAHGLVEPFPFARLIRDLQMYLRQPAPDAVLARVGSSGLQRAVVTATPARK